MLQIKNVTVLTPEETMERARVVVDGGRILAVGGDEEAAGSPQDEIFDASGLLLAPGFIELQINGAFGLDFTEDPQCIWQVASRLPVYGVTSFLPTIITSPLETIARAQEVIKQGSGPGFRGATPLGLHLEGPYLNPERKGAHQASSLRQPSLKEFAGVSLENGIRLVTLAPELPGALDLVRALTERGVVVSAGHSMATLEQARQGFRAGIRYGTHLFNAMAPFHQFEPGLVGALLSEPGARFGLIADGIHVHPEIVSLVWKLTGAGRLTLVTDAMAALGMPPGRYSIGPLKEVQVDGTSARLPGGVLAGSIISQDTALRNLVAFTGCSLPAALSALTSTPADLLGIKRGRIAPGYPADLVLLSPDLRVIRTYTAGEVVYSV